MLENYKEEEGEERTRGWGEARTVQGSGSGSEAKSSNLGDYRFPVQCTLGLGTGCTESKFFIPLLGRDGYSEGGALKLFDAQI